MSLNPVYRVLLDKSDNYSVTLVIFLSPFRLRIRAQIAITVLSLLLEHTIGHAPT
jgi:hypothetical protein